MYQFGTEWEDKWYADSVFMHNMLLLIDAQRDVLSESTIDNAEKRAFMYYRAVEELGKFAFVAGKSGVKSREEVEPHIPKKVYGGEDEEML